MAAYEQGGGYRIKLLLIQIMPTPSFVQLYTGNGKGKTTAALGQAIRALGRGWKVGIIYFDKGGSDYGERTVLDFLHRRYGDSEGSNPPGSPLGQGGQIDYEVTGLDRRNRETGDFRFGTTDEDRAEGARALALAQDWITSGRYQLVVLDEINTAAHLGIVDVAAAVAAVKARHPETEVVLTGRSAPPELLALADLVSNVTATKHYFETGQGAREGIEF